MENKIKTNPVKVIRAHCTDCMGGSYNEIEKCQAEKTCKLWPFRMGKNPYRKQLTDEQKKAVADRFKEAKAEKAE